MKKPKPGIQKLIRDYLLELGKIFNRLDLKNIEKAANLLDQARKKGQRVFILGNGGSAATASHLACDLGKGTIARFSDKKEPRLRVMALTDNPSLLTAFANDLSFADVFVQQLSNLVEKDDLVIVLSGSGNSPNLIKAVVYAKGRGAKTIGFLGFKTGGKLAGLVDCPIIARSHYYGPIEDLHLILGHIIASWLAQTGRKKGSRSVNRAVPFKRN
jgi:D-sedoheptulose 7-phosphate isomerase